MIVEYIENLSSWRDERDLEYAVDMQNQRLEFIKEKTELSYISKDRNTQKYQESLVERKKK